MEQTRTLTPQAFAAGVFCAAALCVTTSSVSAEQSIGEVNVQGGWAYTTREHEDGIEYMATTHAAEDDTWLLLACSADKRLAVSVIHTGPVSLPAKAFLVGEAVVKYRTPLLDRRKEHSKESDFHGSQTTRHIMPVLVQDDKLVVSVPEQDGTTHDYTFTMQPNDLALKQIRSGCFDF
jgi:hypothetical protein